ncbi:MAG: HypC/HybG/HupF family hydrogenase formation chaperone [Patescibacteria group bacterium]|jgi:hydrogenase expression/formation protein HypC
MCLATPVKIVKLFENNSHMAIIDDEGEQKEVDISLLSDLKVGNWLMCHDKMAINVIPDDEAEDILKLAKSCRHHHADHSHSH